MDKFIPPDVISLNDTFELKLEPGDLPEHKHGIRPLHRWVLCRSLGENSYTYTRYNFLLGKKDSGVFYFIVQKDGEFSLVLKTYNKNIPNPEKLSLDACDFVFDAFYKKDMTKEKISVKNKNGAMCPVFID